MNIHKLYSEARSLALTFAARFCVQEEVDSFELSSDGVEKLTKKDYDDLFIGRECRLKLEIFEDEGLITYTEKREFFRYHISAFIS